MGIRTWRRNRRDARMRAARAEAQWRHDVWMEFWAAMHEATKREAGR